MRYTDYDPFAWLYHAHWGSLYHEQSERMLDQVVLGELTPGASILDLCCGDGRVAQALDRRCFQVTGLDGSAEMLRYACERCPGVEFVLGDARDFQFDNRFDAVISTFDSLNHILTLDELTLTFQRTYDALRPGGYFAFDVNREEAYTEFWAQTMGLVEPDMVSIWLGSYDEEHRTASCDITLFRLLDGVWYRSDFRLTQRWHPSADILNALAAAGFIESKEFDAATDLGMYGNIGQGRSYFLGRKSV